MRSVLLIGFGVEGQAAARYFLTRGDIVLATDKRATTDPSPEDFNHHSGFHWIHEDMALTRMNEVDLVLRSPGIPPDHPLFVHAQKLGHKVTTPTGYWLAHHAPRGTMSVTGTKGKSTTVTLIVGLLRAMGKSAEPFGNIGAPPLDENPVSVTHPILELSSYMLHDIPEGTHTHLVTNLFRDHTPWHGGEKAYHEAKLRPFHLTPSRSGLSPRKVTTQYNLPNSVTAIEDLITYSKDHLTFAETTLAVEGLPDEFRDGPKLLALQAAIASIIKLTGEVPSPDQIKQATESFTGLPSRQEIVPSKDGRCWINDALATIPEATIHALCTYKDKPVTLLLGGADRDQDFSSLATAVSQRKDVQPIIFGSTAVRLAKEFQNAGVAFEIVESYEDALALAAKLTTINGLILFSPAAASEPPHGNFSVRAKIFRSTASNA